jgi:hypothetical protein
LADLSSIESSRSGCFISDVDLTEKLCETLKRAMFANSSRCGSDSERLRRLFSTQTFIEQKRQKVAVARRKLIERGAHHLAPILVDKTGENVA